jgi:hypothetical protein
MKFLAEDAEEFHLFRNEFEWVKWNLTSNKKTQPIGWVTTKQIFTYYGVVREEHVTLKEHGQIKFVRF